MKCVATMMVRDEIDVVAAVVEHTLAQGVDLLIVTDNGSVDGTTEVLQRYADLGVVELHHDPVHRKQQHSVVTGMARRAFTEHGADWVLNIDADEFYVPVDRSLTLREALEKTPTSLGAFTVPVVNLVGRPARRGSGLTRLVWRDHRTTEQLVAVGLHAQPTPNAIHRGDAEVTVAQGNHFVSIESEGEPDAAVAIEVLHVPWRSWQQLEQKVSHAGRAYEANPDLKPSRNHHGMADYRRWKAGRLLPAFLLRQPSPAELAAGAADGSFERDEWLVDHVRALVADARCPDLLEVLLDDSADDPFSEEEVAQNAVLGRQFLELEQERMAETIRADDAEKEARAQKRKLKKALARLEKIEATPYRRARRFAGRVRRRLTR